MRYNRCVVQNFVGLIVIHSRATVSSPSSSGLLLITNKPKYKHVWLHISALSSALKNWCNKSFRDILPSIILTYSMEHSSSWEANWFLASQEIPRILWNPKVHHRSHKCPPPVPILSQLDQVHTPTSHFLEIHRNLSLSWASSIQSIPTHPTSWRYIATCPYPEPVRSSPYPHIPLPEDISQPVPSLSQLDPVHTPTSHFLKIYRNLSLSWASSVRFIPPHPTSWRYIATCPYPEPALSGPYPHIPLPEDISQPVPILSQFDPVHTHTSHFLKVHLLVNSLAAAVSEPTQYRLLTFQVPYLMTLFRCLGRNKISVQVSEAYCLSVSQEDTFLRWWVVSTSPNPPAGGPPFLGCPRLPIPYIRSYPPYWRLFLHPQSEDASCLDDRDPIITGRNPHACPRNTQWD